VNPFAGKHENGLQNLLPQSWEAFSMFLCFFVFEWNAGGIYLT
jgi:hypothetical protein